ncbi:malonate transporter [Pseudomonas sp. SORGH_AS199]|jgi:predicted permease|uniref:AEC family transporter n=1 Tax=unclassified Pseudomonas TaxID=196821 RepID=UPI00235E8E6D|nr:MULTISPECIES: AEC family transporter [unclassified Pseudomonas]MDR6231525.1 malonate transporter [Pseudomonas sp. SORGH_AS_0199]
MIETISEALAPIIFVTLLGWGAGRWKVLPQTASKPLATFVVTFALPIALFLAAAHTRPEQILNLPYVATLATGLIGVWLLGLLLGRYRGGRTWREGAMRGITVAFPNMAYCGPPVLTAAIGPSAVLAVIVGNLIFTLVVIPLSLLLLSGGGARQALGKALRQPLVILPLLGLLCALLGIRLPQLLVTATDEIGRAAGGVALFTLGLILSGIQPRLDRDIGLNVALKNLLQPLVMLGVGLAVGLQGGLLQQVFLLGVLPAATAAPTLAMAHGVYTEDAARSVLFSTLVAIPGIALGIALTTLL